MSKSVWIVVAVVALSVAGSPLGCGGADEDPEEALREASAELQAAKQSVEAAQAFVDERQAAVDDATADLDEARKDLAKAQALERKKQAAVSDKATDSALFRAVQRRLLEDEQLDGLAIAADVNRGVVVLRGRVSTAAQRDHAVAVARATPGVVRVDTKIDVPAPKPKGN